MVPKRIFGVYFIGVLPWTFVKLSRQESNLHFQLPEM
jgi:hypothetical protein